MDDIQKTLLGKGCWYENLWSYWKTLLLKNWYANLLWYWKTVLVKKFLICITKIFTELWYWNPFSYHIFTELKTCFQKSITLLKLFILLKIIGNKVKTFYL